VNIPDEAKAMAIYAALCRYHMKTRGAT